MNPSIWNRIASYLRHRTAPLILAGCIHLSACFGIAGITAHAAQPDTPAGTPAQSFVGTWQTRLKGDTFFIIRLALQQGRITGSTNRVEIGFGKTGEITTAVAHEGSDPILDSSLADGTLRIMTEEEDSIRLEIRLTGPDQAELRIFSTNDSNPIKPLKLERTKP